MRTSLLISSFLILGIGCKSKVSNKKVEEAAAIFKDVNVTEAKSMIAENKDENLTTNFKFFDFGHGL